MTWQSISNREADARETYISVKHNFVEVPGIMQAMLLAAGLGTRLRPYSLIRPKPLFPILNQPLLSILLNTLKGVDCSRIVVNGHHLGSQVQSCVSEWEGVRYQFEPDILGTGGSLRQALYEFKDAPLLVMNGDIFHNIDLEALYVHHVQSGNRITMAMHDCCRFNTVAVKGDTVKSFTADPTSEKELLAFTGIHVVNPEIIEMIPSGGYFHIIDLYEKVAGQGENIGVYRVDGSFWEDIGTPDDYLRLHGELLSAKVQQHLPVKIPARKWLVSEGIQIQEDVVLDGWGCIGNARIGAGVHLRNCVVWDDAVIDDGERVENKIIIPA